MIRLLSDEDLNDRIVRGLRRLEESIDIVCVREVGLTGKHDSEVLAWAAAENRVLLTHDAATMIRFAYLRISENLPMPGLVAISQFAAIGDVIDDIAVLAGASTEGEWAGQVIYVPYR